MGNTIERCEVVNDLDGGGVKAVRLTDGRYVTEKLARELAMKLEEELDKWRHEHFHGKRDDHFSGEYLERTSQLELARYFAQWGTEHAREQMMKDAVPFYEILKVVPPGPERDRVLLIVVKEGRL